MMKNTPGKIRRGSGSDKESEAERKGQMRQKDNVQINGIQSEDGH